MRTYAIRYGASTAYIDAETEEELTAALAAISDTEMPSMGSKSSA